MSTTGDQHPDVALELDCRDLPCPMPVIELARHLADVEVGQHLGVGEQDHPAPVLLPD